jgi:hypothetical protein
LPGAACASWKVSATFAGPNLTDVLLAGVGLLIAAMTGVASALVALDLRADVAEARAWQDINTEWAVAGTAAEKAAVVGIDARYTNIPQDEGLRRILLAHRFILPVPSLTVAGSAAPPSADTVAAGEIDGVRSGTELQIADQRPATDRDRAHMAATCHAAFACPPLPIAGKLKEIGKRGQRDAKRRVSRELLVANGGLWCDGPVRSAVDARRAPADASGADVIVLADRSGRDGQQAHPEAPPVRETTAQPGCRGPPAGVSQGQVSSEPRTIGKSFREKDQSRAKASADPAVVDNLGDRVPVGAAELEVVECYLNDVMGELLAAVGSGRSGKTS